MEKNPGLLNLKKKGNKRKKYENALEGFSKAKKRQSIEEDGRGQKENFKRLRRKKQKKMVINMGRSEP